MVRRTGPEGLLRAIFPHVPFEAPVFHYIVEEGREVSIIRVLAEALDALPPTRGKGEANPSPRMKIVLQSLYQIEARKKSTADLAKQMGVSTGTILAAEKRGLYYLSQPSFARRLKRFIASTPEEVAALEERVLRLEGQLLEALQENRNYEEQLKQYRENERRMLAALRRAGITEPELNDIEALERSAEGRYAFQRAMELLRERVPQDPAVARVLNALQRNNVHDVARLKQALERGEVRRFRNVGEKGAEIARELLRTAQEEVLPREELGP
ncbi:MAG: hypothetical protein Q8P12_05740 [bacterium]|nr:hypothetical protein [bacterium]